MSAATAGEAGRAYRRDLDGVRALAILSVVLYHAGVPRFTGGFAGVDVFFVLSGYLIGRHIYTELRDGTFSFARFYQRRAKRILPALFAVLGFTLVAAMLLLSPAEAEELGRGALAATLSASNILFWATTNYFAGKSSMNPLLMTWSLGVEEQFYLVVPLLLAGLSHVRRSWILPAALAVCGASFAFAWAELGSHPMLVFYMLPARAWELGAGVALAVAEADRGEVVPARRASVAGIAGLALMLAPMFLIKATTPFPGPAALATVVGTAMVIAVPASWVNRSVLSLAPLVFVGRVSYSFYLWHWPLLAFAHVVYGGDVPRTMAFAVIGLAFALAVVSYFLIEQPFRRSRRAGGPLLMRYALVSSVMLAVCMAMWASGGAAWRFPELARMERAADKLRADPCLAGYGRDAPTLTTACRSAGPNDSEVALWGDSHAAALAPGLRAAAGAQRLGFVELAKASCPPMVSATHASPRIPMLGAECSRFNARVFDLLRTDARIRVVVLNGEWAGYLYQDWQDGWLAPEAAGASKPLKASDSRALFAASLEKTISALEASGKRVVVIDDVPGFEADPVWKVRTRLIPARRALARLLRVRDATDEGSAKAALDPHAAEATTLLRQATERLAGVELIDLKPVLCARGDECIYRDGNKLLYADSNHMTADGALYVARGLRFPGMSAAAVATNTQRATGGPPESDERQNGDP
jgi:peptidoglycan/LPS O-acetylase OafA/YrhL